MYLNNTVFTMLQAAAHLAALVSQTLDMSSTYFVFFEMIGWLSSLWAPSLEGGGLACSP